MDVTHMYKAFKRTTGHRSEDCRELRRNIQNLIDVTVFTSDLVNQKDETSDWSKAHHANHPNPTQYSPINYFIIRTLDLTIIRLKDHGMNVHICLKSPNK